MSIDYNSFMQGVITGLKLGRTKLGRQPPAPSGRYILTQEGIPIVSETEVDWGDISVFDTDVWYNLAAPYYNSYDRKTYTQVKYRLQLISADETMRWYVSGQLFFMTALFQYTEYEWVACTSEEMSYNEWGSLWVHLRTAQGEESSLPAVLNASHKRGTNEAGISYIPYSPIYISTYDKYLPDGADNVLQVDSYYDLDAYMDNRTLVPLITE